MDFYNSYPTKSANFVARSLPSSRISFAEGTKFTNKFDRHHSDMIRRSTYNIKPIKHEKETVMRYRAPAATVPVGPYQTVSKMDYVYPSEDLLRAMNPQPKWIYRSKSDLGVGRILDHNYQYFSNGRNSTITGEISEKRNESVASNNNKTESCNEFGRCETSIPNEEYPPTEIEEPSTNKQFSSSDNDNSYYAFYKPLVGDYRDRYIENAFMKRAVEGVIIPFQIDKRNIDSEKKSFAPRQMRFTDTFNKVLLPRPDSIPKFPMKFPQLNRINVSQNVAGKNNRTKNPLEISANPTTRVSLYQKAPAAQSIDRDMIRTYEKQAKLREMIQK